MQAIRHHEFGPPDVLRLEDLPDVHPGPDEVRIAVEASGVHLLDTSIREGREGGPFPLPMLPTTPGREVAGVVDELGAGVDASMLGGRVVAHLGQASGGYATLAVAPVGAVRAIPAGLDAGEAVALIGTGRTAMAVLDHAALQGDDVVIVTAAAGGLGSLFVQSARRAGATVVGLAGGAPKVAVVDQLGADVAVDYSIAGWTDVVRDRLGGKEPTLVLDGVGGELGRGAFDLLGTGGRIILFGYSSGSVTAFTSADLAARGLSASWSIGPAMM
jgi:NADPH2:quinone reductase